MACYHPMKVYFHQKGIDDLYKKEIFFSYGKWRDYLPDSSVSEIDLPCGKCIGCLMDKSRDWSVRISLEASLYEHNYFVTLTYDDDHLPSQCGEYFDTSTGEVKPVLVHSLLKKDVTDFKKRVLDRFRQCGHVGIRFFYSGEYGSLNLRPHYHIIFFNLPLNDLVFWKNDHGNAYYRSPLLEECWNKGFVVVGEVTQKSAAYVARYCFKKQHHKRDVDFLLSGLVPEFIEMSNRPGIASDYFDQHFDEIYKRDYCVVPGVSFPFRPPKYFDEKFREMYPKKFFDISCDRRDHAIEGHKVMLSKSDYNEFELLEIAEDEMNKRVLALRRDL